MERKLTWQSGQLKSIERAYQKAESAGLSAQMEQLETQALAEARVALDLLEAPAGRRITPEQFDALPEDGWEVIIRMLGAGVTRLQPPGGATSIITLTPSFPRVQACSIFFLLDFLSRVDSTILPDGSEKWTMILQVPPGGNKELHQWEMLMMQIFPWLSVQETASNAVAKKKPFWKRLFGK